MPVITLNRNDNATVTKALKKPGIMVLGKNRNAVKSELEKGESAFRVKFLTGAEEINDDISELIIMTGDDSRAEALKYAFLADEKGIPHLLITTSVGGNSSVRFLHILYTDEMSLPHAVAAVTSMNQTQKERLFAARESFYVYAYSAGHDNEAAAELFAKLLDRIPNFNFGKTYMTLHTPHDISENKTLKTVSDTIHPVITYIQEDGDGMRAEVLLQ